MDLRPETSSAAGNRKIVKMVQTFLLNFGAQCRDSNKNHF